MSKILSPLYTATQQFDANGVPLAGGKLYTFVAGTSTPKPTFTDITGTVQNPNPIVLDSSGYLPNAVWVTPSAAYKFELRDADGNIIPGHTTDNVSFGGGGGSGGASLPFREIGFGTGTGIESSRELQYNPDATVGFGRLEFWSVDEAITDPYFRMGCEDAEVYSVFSLDALVTNPLDGTTWDSPFQIHTNWSNNTSKVVLGDVMVNSLGGINLVNTITGLNGLSPTYSTSGEVTIGIRDPQKSLTSTQAVSNTEVYLPVTGFACSLPAGSTYRVKINGTCTSTASGSTTWRMKIGTANNATDSTYLTFTTTVPASGSSIPFTLEMELSVRAEGSSGQVVTSGFLVNNGTTGISSSAVVVNAGSISTVDTTAGNYLGVSAQTSSANISLSVRQMTIERVL